jgi:hypothetical protein
MTTEPQKPFAVGDKVTIMEHSTPIETATVLRVNKRWVDVQLKEEDPSRYHLDGSAMRCHKWGPFFHIEHTTSAHIDFIKRRGVLNRIILTKSLTWSLLSTDQLLGIISMLEKAHAERNA